eukprot:236265-Amphidinium_carterae.1
MSVPHENASVWSECACGHNLSFDANALQAVVRAARSELGAACCANLLSIFCVYDATCVHFQEHPNGSAHWWVLGRMVTGGHPNKEQLELQTKTEPGVFRLAFNCADIARNNAGEHCKSMGASEENLPECTCLCIESHKPDS